MKRIYVSVLIVIALALGTMYIVMAAQDGVRERVCPLEELERLYRYGDSECELADMLKAAYISNEPVYVVTFANNDPTNVDGAIIRSDNYQEGVRERLCLYNEIEHFNYKLNSERSAELCPESLEIYEFILRELIYANMKGNVIYSVTFINHDPIHVDEEYLGSRADYWNEFTRTRGLIFGNVIMWQVRNYSQETIRVIMDASVFDHNGIRMDLRGADRFLMQHQVSELWSGDPTWTTSRTFTLALRENGRTFPIRTIRI